MVAGLFWFRFRLTMVDDILGSSVVSAVLVMGAFIIAVVLRRIAGVAIGAEVAGGPVVIVQIQMNAGTAFEIITSHSRIILSLFFLNLIYKVCGILSMRIKRAVFDAAAGIHYNES